MDAKTNILEFGTKALVGFEVGIDDGNKVGDVEGSTDGRLEGFDIGCFEGLEVGNEVVGDEDGADEGISDG